MRTKFKFLVVSVFVLTGLIFSAYSTYAFSGHHGRGGEIKRLKWVLDKGGQPLTDDQRAQIKEIMKTTWTQLKPTISDLKTNRRALRDLIISGKAEDAEIKTQVDAMVPMGTIIAEQRALAFNQVVTTVLTDAQRNVLQQFKAQKAQ